MRPDTLASMDTQKQSIVNFDTKSQLAKLIATENIEVQHNKVKTASYDTLNRILTLPLFKQQSGDVYDMLIAHECAHALWTPTDGWAKLKDDNELRSYVNVLEDCRIDRMIQKKYPGVVKNYINGFDILDKQNFFSIKDKDINKDLMLIDKINLFYKSSKRLPINFSFVDKKWLGKIDNLKSFDDVVNLAKSLLNWQKKQVEEMKKLPDFDLHSISKIYKLNDDDDMEDMDSDEEADKIDEESQSEISDNDGDEEMEDNGEDKKDTDIQKGANPEAQEGGGSGVAPDKLKAITNDSYEEQIQKLYDSGDDVLSYNYFDLPNPNLSKAVVSNKKFLKDMRSYAASECNKHYQSMEYFNWLKDAYKKFKNENKKTVMYLVKEFEMKKSATAYKRATTDKTGIIDPLKLKEYKYSDDIFKKLTILPDAKNHGMMMLLDWSGSMCDTIQQTTEQLMNLVWFCQKVNIPFEVYAFSSEYQIERYTKTTGDKTFTYKSGNGIMSDVRLICLANSYCKKKELDESLMHLWHMSQCYTDRYTRGFERDYKGDRYYMPQDYYLGSTPLNEALVVLNKMIPMFKDKNKIEKMSLITLTDGGANHTFNEKKLMTDKGLQSVNMGYNPPVIKVGKKQYTFKDKKDHYRSHNTTGLLLDLIKRTHNISTVGFYVTKRFKQWNMTNFIPEGLNWEQRDQWFAKLRSSMNKQRHADVSHVGYDKYFLLNGKKLNVENTDLSGINDKMKAGGIKRIFAKSMKNRLTSRTLLNRFIEEVA